MVDLPASSSGSQAEQVKPAGPTILQPKPNRRESFKLILQILIWFCLWFGCLSALILFLLGLLSPCRDCLTVGVILGIVCVGVFLHNCLHRGSIPHPLSRYYSSKFAITNDHGTMVYLTETVNGVLRRSQSASGPILLEQTNAAEHASTECGLSSSFPLLKASSASYPEVDLTHMHSEDSRCSLVTIERLDLDYVDSALDGHLKNPRQVPTLDLGHLETPLLNIASAPLQTELQYCNHVNCHAEGRTSTAEHRQSHRHRDCSPTDSSIVDSLTQVIVRSLMRGQPDLDGVGVGSGDASGASGSRHLHRNTWSAFEGHVGWQSARARPAPFFADTFQ